MYILCVFVDDGEECRKMASADTAGSGVIARCSPASQSARTKFIGNARGRRGSATCARTRFSAPPPPPPDETSLALSSLGRSRSVARLLAARAALHPFRSTLHRPVEIPKLDFTRAPSRRRIVSVGPYATPVRRRANYYYYRCTHRLRARAALVHAVAE